jgi:3-isopropylmalate/(R)-2-methylmalate dehydratase small subunit
MASGTITNKTSSKSYTFTPIPDFMMKLLESGGLMNFAHDEISVGEEK